MAILMLAKLNPDFVISESYSFQPFMSFPKRIILTFCFWGHIRIVLSDIGQVSAHYLVWRTVGLSILGETKTVPDLLYREATAVNSNSGPLESLPKGG